MAKRIKVTDISGFTKEYVSLFGEAVSTADGIIASYRQAAEDAELSDAEKRYYGHVSAEKTAALDGIRNPGLFERNYSGIKLFFCLENKATPEVFKGELLKKEDVIYKKMGVMAPEVSCGSHYGRLIKTYNSGCPCRVSAVTANPLTALYFACKDEECDSVTVLAVPECEISYPDSDKALMLSCLPLLSYSQKKDLYEAADFSLSAGRFRQLKGGTRYLDDAPEELYRLITTEKPYFRREISPSDLLKPLFVSPERSDIKTVKQDIYYVISGLCMSEKEAREKIYANAVCEFEIADKEKLLFELDLLGVNGASLCPDGKSAAEYLRNNE